jgi:hypothetical protein
MIILTKHTNNMPEIISGTNMQNAAYLTNNETTNISSEKTPNSTDMQSRIRTGNIFMELISIITS